MPPDDPFPPGTVKWFEYHCWESPESSDAEVWYRSHCEVSVIGLVEDSLCNGKPIMPTFIDRAEAGAESEAVQADGQ